MRMGVLRACLSSVEVIVMSLMVVLVASRMVVRVRMSMIVPMGMNQPCCVGLLTGERHAMRMRAPVGMNEHLLPRFKQHLVRVRPLVCFHLMLVRMDVGMNTRMNVRMRMPVRITSPAQQKQIETDTGDRQSRNDPQPRIQPIGNDVPGCVERDRPE